MKNYSNKIKVLMNFHREFAELIIKGFELEMNEAKKLNRKHYQTIMTLYHHGSFTMHELSTRVMLQKGSFTPVAKKLLNLDYIRKEQSDEDKRISYIHLTEKGKAFAIEFHDKHRVYVEDKFSNLSNEEQDRYFELLDELKQLNEKMK